MEVRSSLLSVWRPAKVPWTDKMGAVAAGSLPVAGFEWEGNWKLDNKEEVGVRDEQGWEYATVASRFGAHRVPRAKGLKDFGRRRKWVRNMVPMSTLNGGGTISQEQKLTAITSLLQGLNKAQKEVKKMGELLGTVDDSVRVRETIQDFLGKVKGAQNEVRRQIECLEGRQMTARGLRELEKIVGPFEATEKLIIEQLQEPLPDEPSIEVEGANARLRQSSVSSGKGAFSGTAGNGVDRGGLGTPCGTYVSRQQQELLMESKLRVVENEVVDREIMEERENHISRILEGQNELNKLFSEMAQHVGNQQDSINQVEGNVDNAALKVQEGIDHLEKAAEHQKTCSLC